MGAQRRETRCKKGSDTRELRGTWVVVGKHIMSAFPEGTSIATRPKDGKACSAVCRAAEVMVLGSGGVEYWRKEKGMSGG